MRITCDCTLAAHHTPLLFVPPDAAIALLVGGARLIAEVLTAEEMAGRFGVL